MLPVYSSVTLNCSLLLVIFTCIIVYVLTDLQSIQRWSFHTDTTFNTCLDCSLLCEISYCCKSTEMFIIISVEQKHG